MFGTENRLLEEDTFVDMVVRELSDGEHIKPNKGTYHGIGRSHFHSADELRTELSRGGFENTRIHGVVGAAWLAPDIDGIWKNPSAKAALMRTVRMIDERDDIIGLSTHLLSVSRR